MLYMTVLAKVDAWVLRYCRQTPALPKAEGRVSNVSCSALSSSQNEWCELSLTSAKGPRVR